VETAIFLLLWSGYHGDMKITEYLAFSSLLALSELNI
jgi:hypothetical protein